MVWIAILTGLAAAALNAGSSVLQRLAASKPRIERLFSLRLTLRVTSDRMFLFGFGLQVSAAICQAIALANGTLTLVQPLLTVDLVFLLLILYLKLRVRTSWHEWLAVAALIGGLAGWFAAAQPHASHATYAPMPWIITIVVLAVIIFTATFIVRRLHTGVTSGILAGVATASSYAANAAFTKLAIDQYYASGFGAVLASWPIYGLVISGISSIYLMQNAYGAGPLAVTQPVIEIASPAISVAIGTVVFGDRLRLTSWALAIEFAGAVAVAWGVYRLSTSPAIRQAGEKGL